MRSISSVGRAVETRYTLTEDLLNRVRLRRYKDAIRLQIHHLPYWHLWPGRRSMTAIQNPYCSVICQYRVRQDRIEPFDATIRIAARGASVRYKGKARLQRAHYPSL